MELSAFNMLFRIFVALLRIRDGVQSMVEIIIICTRAKDFFTNCVIRALEKRE